MPPFAQVRAVGFREGVHGKCLISIEQIWLGASDQHLACRCLAKQGAGKSTTASSHAAPSQYPCIDAHGVLDAVGQVGIEQGSPSKQQKSCCSASRRGRAGEVCVRYDGFSSHHHQILCPKSVQVVQLVVGTRIVLVVGCNRGTGIFPPTHRTRGNEASPASANRRSLQSTRQSSARP